MAFAEKGVSLALTGRNVEGLREVAVKCKDLGAKQVGSRHLIVKSLSDTLLLMIFV